PLVGRITERSLVVPDPQLPCARLALGVLDVGPFPLLRHVAEFRPLALLRPAPRPRVPQRDAPATPRPQVSGPPAAPAEQPRPELMRTMRPLMTPACRSSTAHGVPPCGCPSVVAGRQCARGRRRAASSRAPGPHPARPPVSGRRARRPATTPATCREARRPVRSRRTPARRRSAPRLAAGATPPPSGLRSPCPVGWPGPRQSSVVGARVATYAAHAR